MNKSEKDKYYMISLIHGIKKNNTNECICKTESDSEKTNLRLPKVTEKWGGTN